MQLSHALPKLPRQQSHSGELAVFKDEHRGLVAGVESNRFPYGAREACNGLLRNQVCATLRRGSAGELVKPITPHCPQASGWELVPPFA